MTENKFYKPVGGILAAELFFVGEQSSLDEILLGQSVAVDLIDDESEYQESVTSERGLVSVEHTLTLASDKWLAREWYDKEFLARCAAEGVVARITLSTSEVLVVGYDPHFGTEQALRLEHLKFLSGKSLGSSPRVELQLRCRDTHSAV